MRVKRYICGCLCVCLLAAGLFSEQWYRVSETELRKLEAISQASETDRRSWLSQAGELRTIVQSLQKDSAGLNAQLERERDATRNLRISFERSASEQSRRASDYETALAGLKEEKAKAEISALKATNQRNALFFVLLGLAGVFGAVGYFRIKTFFLK